MRKQYNKNSNRKTATEKQERKIDET